MTRISNIRKKKKKSTIHSESVRLKGIFYSLINEPRKKSNPDMKILNCVLWCEVSKFCFVFFLFSQPWRVQTHFLSFSFALYLFSAAHMNFLCNFPPLQWSFHHYCSIKSIRLFILWCSLHQVLNRRYDHMTQTIIIVENIH